MNKIEKLQTILSNFNFFLENKLTVKQFQLIKTIGNRKITTLELSGELDTCRMSMQQRLKGLYKKGYLDREIKYRGCVNNVTYVYFLHPYLSIVQTS